jgi:hypothetical protein
MPSAFMHDLPAEPSECYAIVRHGLGSHSIQRAVAIDAELYTVGPWLACDLTAAQARQWLATRSKVSLPGIWRNPPGSHTAGLIEPNN